MTFRVSLHRLAKRGLARAHLQMQRRLAVQLQELERNPRPAGVRKLADSANEWRVRVGDYRIIYEIDVEDRQVTVLRIAHRREVETVPK